MSEIEVTELSRKLDRVLLILENDDKTGYKGLVHQTAENKKAIEEMLEKERLKEAVQAGKMAVYGLIGGAVIWIITLIIKLIFPFLLKYI